MKLIDLVKKVILILLLVLTFFLFYRPLEMEDNWWHLSTGRWMMEHHSVPHVDPFPAMGEQTPWVLTQWLGSYSFYCVYSWQGLDGLKVMRLLIFMIIFGIYFLFARRKLPFVFLVSVIFLMEYGMTGRFLLRPDIFNYIFIQLLLILLFSHYQDGRKRALWGVLALGAVWGNIHLGSFVYGYLLIILFLFSAFVRWVSLKMGNKEAVEKNMLASRLNNLVVLLFLYPLALCVSPYGIQAGLYPFKVFLMPDFIQIYKFVNVIGEALPPLYIFGTGGFWFIILSLGALICLIVNKKDQLLYVLLFVFPLFLFLRGTRASGFFVIVTVYVIAQCAHHCRFVNFWKSWPYARVVDVFLLGGMIFLLVFQVHQGLTERVYINGRFTKMLDIDIDPRAPIDAVNFLKENEITGLVFSNHGWGGFLLWSAYPTLKPFIDGRQLRPDLFFKAFSVMRDPQIYWPNVASEFDIKVVLLNTSNKVIFRFLEYLSHDSGWEMVFLKGSSVVFVKRGAFHLKENLDHFQDELHARAVDIKDMEALAAMSSIHSASSWMRPVDLRYNDVLEEATTLLGLGYPGAGAARLVQAYRATGDGSVCAIAPAALKIIQQNTK